MVQKKKNDFPANDHEKIDLQQKNTTIMTRQQLTVRSGLLPSPEDLEHYDRISPGFAQDFMNLVKSEQSHRHLQDDQEMELVRKDLEIKEEVVKNEFFLSMFGVIAALIMGLAVIGGGFYIAIALRDIGAGVALIGTLVAGMIGAFVYGTKKNHQKEEK